MQSKACSCRLCTMLLQTPERRELAPVRIQSCHVSRRWCAPTVCLCLLQLLPMVLSASAAVQRTGAVWMHC